MNKFNHSFYSEQLSAATPILDMKLTMEIPKVIRFQRIRIISHNYRFKRVLRSAVITDNLSNTGSSLDCGFA